MLRLNHLNLEQYSGDLHVESRAIVGASDKGSVFDSIRLNYGKLPGYPPKNFIFATCPKSHLFLTVMPFFSLPRCPPFEILPPCPQRGMRVRI